MQALPGGRPVFRQQARYPHMVTGGEVDFDRAFRPSDLRIHDGQDAELGQFPFVVFINVQVGLVFYSCTGALVSPTVVVTTATCLEGGTMVQVRDTTLSRNIDR